MNPFLPPALVVFAIYSTSPFIGTLRDWLFDSLPFRATEVLMAGFGVIGLICAGWALQRARRHPIWSGCWAVALGVCLWLQTIAFGTGTARVDLVERVHIIEYGALGFLWCRALAIRHRGILSITELGTVFLWATLAGALEETIQLFSQTRTGDIRDVALDGFAGVCGIIFWVCVSPPSSCSRRFTDPRTTLRAASMTVLAVGLFFSAAHLGQVIHDPEIGRFISWHSRAELERAQRDRAQRWSADPPTKLSPWRIEDFYLTEAGSHAHHRNASYHAGDLALARQANLILEKYFAPYLDLDNFLEERSRRYPDWILQRLEAEGATSSASNYFSPVLRGRIYTWTSAPVLISLVGLASLVLWVLSLAVGPRRAAGSATRRCNDRSAED